MSRLVVLPCSAGRVDFDNCVPSTVMPLLALGSSLKLVQCCLMRAVLSCIVSVVSSVYVVFMLCLFLCNQKLYRQKKEVSSSLDHLNTNGRSGASKDFNVDFLSLPPNADRENLLGMF